MKPLVERRTLMALLVVVLAADLALLAEMSEADDWQPVSLLVVLVGFAVVSELGSARFGALYFSSSMLAIVLALALLGPGPAALVAASTVIPDHFVYRKPAVKGFQNLVVYVTLAVLGALALELLAGAEPREVPAGDLATAVFGTSLIVGLLNFGLVIAVLKLNPGCSARQAFTATYLPTVPYQLVGATLAAAAAHAHAVNGLPMLAGVVTVLVVSELLIRATSAAGSRAEEIIALTRQRSELLEESLAAEAAERARLAEHLHDQTLQLLAAAEQDLDDALEGDETAVRRARSGLGAAVSELRHTLIHAHPTAMESGGLEAAFRAYAGQLGRKLRLDVAVDGRVEPRLEGLLYAVGRELIGNACKHAHATTVGVEVSTGDPIRLVVSDDGRGFDPATPSRPGHVGLATADRRVRAAGGRLTIVSTPEGGTVAEALVPARRPVTLA